MKKHVLKINDLTDTEIKEIIKRAQDYNLKYVSESLINKKIMLLFLENSTRTKISFEAAIKNLGGQVLHFDKETSSMKKNETLLDTILTLEAMGIDGIVIRTSNHDELMEIATKVKIPIINAGSGSSEHPTQALLDLVTIKDNFKDLANLQVTFVGDIINSRVAKSNIQLMEKMKMKVCLTGPKEWIPETEMHRYVSSHEAYQNSDVIILLRAQLERNTQMKMDASDYLKEFGFTEDKINLMKPNAIVMHPGPFMRGVEIQDELVLHPKSRIFSQVSNGVKARMALLKMLYS